MTILYPVSDLVMLAFLLSAICWNDLNGYENQEENTAGDETRKSLSH